MSFILAFDTETTGLPRTVNGIIMEPHITQLSAILFSVSEKQIISFLNSYIKLPPGVEISPKAQEISGITPEICQQQGKTIDKVLKSFYSLYKQADVIVAHNLDFDVDRICAEIQRIVLSSSTKKIPKFAYMFSPSHMPEHVQMICTMKQDLVATGRWPKLIDLYRRTFGYSVQTHCLHHSFVDSLLCLRILLKNQYHITIPDIEFEKWLTLFSSTEENTTRKFPWRQCKDKNYK